MKKIIAITAILAVMSAFAGCSNSSSSSSSESTTSASETTETTTVEEDTTAEETTTEADTAEATTEAPAAEAETEAATEAQENGNTESEAEYLDIASKLMTDMTVAEQLGSTNIQQDANQPLADDSKYFKVTNGTVYGYNFTSVAEIKDFLSGSFTGEAYDKFSYIVEGDSPVYVDGPDGLYSIMGGRGTRYNWINGGVTLVSSSDNEFIVEAQDNIQGDLTFSDMHFVKENGSWKIDKISDGFPLS